MKQFAILILLASPAVAQTTWYVDAAAPGPGTGTATDPFLEVQSGIDAATGYLDKVLVAPGVYFGNLTFGSQSIIVESEAGPGVTFIEPDLPGAVVRLDGLEPELRGFTIRNGYGNLGDGVRVPDSTEYALIERCVLTGHRRGINWRSGAGRGRVVNCTMVGNSEEGLWMKPFSAVGLFSSIIWGNGSPPVLSLGGSHCCGNTQGFYFNIIETDPGGWEGTCTGLSVGQVCGNFDADPLFWGEASGDFMLRPGSPAIDATDPSLWSPSAVWPLDPDGSLADLGAFIFDPVYAAPPSVYCTSKVNSQGCTPAIGSSGVASMTGAAFDLTCVNVVNNKQGLLFYGYQPKASPFQGGWLCVQAPVKRTQVQSSFGNPPPDDCSGQYVFDFDAHIQSGIDPGLVAGALVHAQYWYRDPAQAGSFTTGRSDALSFGIAP